MLKNYKLSNQWLQAMDLDDFQLTKDNVIHKNQKNQQNHYNEIKSSNVVQESTSSFSREYIIEDNNSAYSTHSYNEKTKNNLGAILPEKNKPINHELKPSQYPSEHPASQARSIADSVNTIEELRESLEKFDGCRLKFGANNTVFASGNQSSEIMLIGEAPGASEDAQGIPFCGQSGKLLDKMLSSISLSREKNFYITNTVFWRPPANRAPSLEESEICMPFVEKHIALKNPKLLILVGGTAVASLLGKHLKISKIRQEYYDYKNKYLAKPIPTTAIFHPAYLLRQPGQKKTSWFDLLKIQNFILKNEIRI